MTAATDRAPQRSGPPEPGVRALVRGLLPQLALVALTLAVWHRALALYFSQDDFFYLGRVRGLVPRLDQPWRWLSQELVWDLTRPFGVETALPQHLVSLGVHLACVLLLFHLVSRRLSRPAAFVGAAFFATHPSAFHAVYWASAIADPLQLAFALAALAFALRQDRACWFAVPAFAFSLLSKEGLVLLPAIVVLHRLGPGAAPWPLAAAGEPRRRLRGVELALVATAAAFLLYFFLVAYPSRFGAVALPGGASAQPYGIALGPNFLANLVTYLGWTANIVLPTVRAFSDVADPGMLPWGAVLAVVALAGCAWPALRARGWVEGAGTYVAFLLPVLLLRDHTYHYYLYGALAGATICVAALVDLVTGARVPSRAGARGPRRAGRAPRRAGAGPGFGWSVAAIVVLLMGLNGALLVRKIELHPLGHGGRRADPIVDRAIIARRSFESLRDDPLPDGTVLLLWSPPRAGDASAGGGDYWARNVEAAVAGAVGMAVMAPGLAGSTFVPAPRALAAEERLGIYRHDGTIEVATAERAESLARQVAVGPGGAAAGPVTATPAAGTRR